jgi:hypothetical protein
MRLHSGLRALVFVSLFALSASVSAQEKPADEAKYKFKKGDVLKYEVTSTLEATQAGTHSHFLMDGNDKPLTWHVNGTFENVVLDEQGGVATLERRVKQISSTGHVQWPGNLEKFKFTWSGEKDKEKPDPEKINSLMDKFAATMVARPEHHQVTVDQDGNQDSQNPDLKRLVMRRGMMAWPLRGNEITYTTVEEIALPVLHDKIKIEFKNTVTGETTGGGARIRKISAVASLKESAKAGFHPYDLAFTVSGGAKVEFDITHGRIHKLEYDVVVRFSGKGQVGDGSEGDIKGVASYKETQVYKD